MSVISQKKLYKEASLNKKESSFLEFKSEIDINSTIAWCEIIKDIVAMANSGGGIILFGINDDGTLSNFDRKIIMDLDPAYITEKVSKYLGEDFTDFEIIEVIRSKSKVAGIYIKGVSTPYVFSVNGAQTREGKKFKSVFAEGTVYFRRGAKSRPGNTKYIKDSFKKALDEIRKEWFGGMKIVSELGVNEKITIQKKENTKPITNIGRCIKLSDEGSEVRFSNERVEELKKLFPLSYKNVRSGCKKIRKVNSKIIQNYIERCKLDPSLSINWKTVSNNLTIPINVPDKFTYSKKVVSNFK